MKKIFLMSFALLVIFTCSAFAAKEPPTTLGIVIIGGSEFKTADYYKMIPKVFDFKKNITCKIGDEMQSRYQKFLLEYDLVGNDTPKKQNLIDFAARSGCNKILFLVVDSSADHQNDFKSKQKNRLTVQTDAYLCDGLQVIDVQTTTQESDSKASDLRARREAFKKTLTELAKAIKTF